MSIININCMDQTLKIVNSPIITAGDENEDYVQFSFYPSWDGYTKIAIFYKNKSELHYSIIDDNNRCAIPNSMLTNEGIVCLGVVGFKNNNGTYKTRTTEVLRYNITEGILNGYGINDPTLSELFYNCFKTAEIDENGHLIITLFNNSTIDAGLIPQIQPDWEQSDDEAVDYIKNKPAIYTKDETDALLYPKATREWVQNQGYLTEHQDISGKQDKLIAGDNITIENNVISASAGSSGKEPFYAIYNVTPYEDVKQAIIDGRQLFLVYDTGSRTTKYVMLNYIGHNKGTDPYDVSAAISGYIFRFCGVDGSSSSAGGIYTEYYVRLNSNGTYSAYTNNLVSDRQLVEFNPDGDYNDDDVLTAYGVIEAIETALAQLPSAEGGSY